MAIAVNTGIKILGTEVVMETNGAQLNNDAFATCADATFDTAAVEGLPFAQFEFDCAAGGFSAAPTDGAIINIYEMPFNSNGSQGPQIDATYKKNLVGHFSPDVADTQQFFITEGPINYYGGEYVLEWIDGGAGSASIDSAWIFRVIPFGIGPSV